MQCRFIMKILGGSMGQLPFNMAVMQFLAEQRNVFLTKFLLLASFLGEVEGYILIITLIYVMFDKRLAVRLAVLVLLTMSLNHVLKIIIKNPRPFIREGDYLKKWAVSAENAEELATEYSTPSGHAMAASAFYSYLYKAVRNRHVRVAAVIAILLTGLSRPYLGVHFLEDILVGWVIGLSVALVAIKYAEGISNVWKKFSYKRQVAVVVVASLVLWVVTITINGWRVDGQPRAFLGYAGFLTGIVIGRPLELNVVDFDPRSSNWAVKILRYLISVGMVIVMLQLLGKVFGGIADNFSMLGYVLQYVRYTVAGIVSIFLAPLFLAKVRLAETNPIRVGSMEHL
jgi:membrane-associated phospholipid phosphatase